MPSPLQKKDDSGVVEFVNVCYMYTTAGMSVLSARQRRHVHYLQHQADTSLGEIFPLPVSKLTSFLESEVARYLVAISLDRAADTSDDEAGDILGAISYLRGHSDRQLFPEHVWRYAVITHCLSDTRGSTLHKSHSAPTEEQPIGDVLNSWRALHHLLRDISCRDGLPPSGRIASLVCVVRATVQCLQSCCGVALTQGRKLVVLCYVTISLLR